MSQRMIVGGVVGGVIAALCCFTPVLVVLFGALGLSAWLGWADYVLMPALLFFVLLTGFTIYRHRRNANAACGSACTPGSRKNGARP